jgi:hypothetical protein
LSWLQSLTQSLETPALPNSLLCWRQSLGSLLELLASIVVTLREHGGRRLQNLIPRRTRTWASTVEAAPLSKSARLAGSLVLMPHSSVGKLPLIEISQYLKLILVVLKAFHKIRFEGLQATHLQADF